MLRIACALFMAVFIFVTLSSAGEYPTIVGSWYQPEHGVKDCSSHWGTHIEPMGLLTGETMCEFRDVRRDGWIVTWRGTCHESGDTLPNMTDVAAENAGTLSISFSDGGTISDLRRCPKP